MAIDIADLIAIDQRALAATGEIIGAVRPEQLDSATPCGDWTLGELLGHLVASNLGFAAALGGDPVGAQVWESVAVPDLVFAAYLDSAARVSAGFARLAPDIRVPIFGYGNLRPATALGMHIVDTVVHGWDIARSTGWVWRYDPELVERTYQIMLGFPTDRPNKAFGVIKPVPEDAPITDRLMGYVGRDPAWLP